VEIPWLAELLSALGIDVEPPATPTLPPPEIFTITSTPTPTETATPTPEPILASTYDTTIDLYLLAGTLESQQGITTQEALEQGYQIQNQYNQIIIDAVTDPEGPWADRPDLHDQLIRITKRLVINESQFRNDYVDPADNATGFGQVTPDFLFDVVANGGLPDREYDLFDPEENLEVVVGSLRWLYDGVQGNNEEYGWEMDDRTMLMFSVGMYNAGWGGDFGEENRVRLEEGQLSFLGPDCTDPTEWTCLKAIFYRPIYENETIVGYDTNPPAVQYVENIFGDFNAPPREDK
jgi:hypothetical protein